MISSALQLLGSLMEIPDRLALYQAAREVAEVHDFMQDSLKATEAFGSNSIRDKAYKKAEEEYRGLCCKLSKVLMSNGEPLLPSVRHVSIIVWIGYGYHSVVTFDQSFLSSHTETPELAVTVSNVISLDEGLAEARNDW